MDKGKTTRILSGGVYMGKDGKRHEWAKIHGYKPEKITDDNWMEYGMPADEGTNESKNMNKKLIRLTESDLHRIVKESVNRILKENHNEDYIEAKQIIDGMDFEDVKTLPERDPRFSFGALNGSEGEGMIDLNFKGILVTVKGIAKVMDNFEKYNEGGQFLGVEG